MIVIPAIDVRGGRAVRLVHGRPESETVYAEDPTDVAAGFVAEGASWLHVVDLDAALGTGNNHDVIARLIGSAGCRVQVGGGLRSAEAVDDALSLGADRVVLGTQAVMDPAFLEALIASREGRIVVAVDTDGKDVLVAGWTESAGTLEDVMSRLESAGAPRLMITAVGRDGTLTGPDLMLYARLRSTVSRPIIASGGIRNAADLGALAAVGVEGAVVGKALYEGTLTVREALEAEG